MKRFLLVLLLLAPLSAKATTTVTGNLNNLGTGTVGSNAFVRFWLRGCQGNQPRVNGTALIAPSQGGVFFFDLVANGSGVISGTLYSTRDSTGLLGGDIDCGGSHLGVWYGLQVFVAGKGGPEMPVHAKNGVTLDITTVIPLSVTPVVTAPSGDVTYARLDTVNQPFTGAITATGETINGSARLKGPIPWRDVTAYMKDSGGNQANCSSTTPVNGADTTGTINSGSASLALAAARDFKNGCGIAVIGAGPTSTLSTPVVTPGVSSASRSSTTVTITTSANHGIPIGLANGNDIGVVMSGCSVGAYNGTFAVQTDVDSTHFTYTTTSGNDTANTCVATFFPTKVHGTGGSTTYNYKVVKIDASGGFSAASPTITVTSANATLSKDNYNWIGVTPDLNAVLYALYSDQGLGGALTCVNTYPGMGLIDIGGVYNPCPPFLPTNPPGAAGAQMLNSTIVSGAGTTTLVLAATASNNATTQNVYHDESSFLNSCLTDTNNAQNTGLAVTGVDYGCVVPPGIFGFNGPLITNTLNPSANLHIHVRGMMNFQTMPWFIKFPYQVYGDSGGGLGGATGDHTGAAKIQFGNAVPAGFVLRTGCFGCVVSGFQMQYVNGTGIWVGGTDPSNSPSGVKIDHNSITSQGALGNAPCMTIDNNVIGLWGDNNTFQAVATSGGMPALYITHTGYASSVVQEIHMHDTTGTWHTVKVDAPGGIGGGASEHDISFDHWFQENSLDTGFIEADGGGSAAGQNGISLGAISAIHVLSSDGGVAALVNEVGGITAVQSVFIDNAPGNLICTPSTLCTSTTGITNFIQVGGAAPNSTGKGITIAQTGSVSALANGGLGVMTPEVNAGGTPSFPPFVEFLPAPVNVAVNSTGAGSLAAGTYCGSFAGLDNTAQANSTDISNIVCQTVGASASITFGFTQGNTSSLSGAYSGFNFHYCFTAGTICAPNKRITGIAAGATTYAFTTDNGSVFTAPKTSTAQLSWIGEDKTNAPLSCFFCVNSGSDAWPVGIGRIPAASLGYNLIADKGYAVGEIADPACATSAIGQLWENNSTHRFKFCSNAVAADTIVGLATTDTLTNKTLNVPLTSGTGLQIFNTTTTCTTGGSVGATCTTAAISLPVAEADTSYRVTCTGKGLTNVPVVIATANSSASQFTITIAALTAAAASFASYDCFAGHN